MNTSTIPWTIAITGASGCIYARRLISAIVVHQPQQLLDVVLSEAALRVLREEEGIFLSSKAKYVEELTGLQAPQVTIHNNKDIGASIASGSHRSQGMVVVPCSMGTLAAMRIGLADSLIRRTADVTLKEQRKLILVPRESPLSEIHLENLLALAKLGVAIIPAMPGFYLQPASIDELVDSIVQRLLDRMGLEISLTPRWKEKTSEDKLRVTAC